jgi:fibronectin-binding autotransporter adhesin
VSVADVHPAGVEFNNTTKNYTVTGSKSIISPGTFTKTGTGTVSLAVPATFAGAASVAAGGTLQIGNGGTTGNLTAASLANEGTLRFNHTGDVTFSTPVSGSGNVVHAGTGATTLSGASTYTGTTDIQAGTVRTTNSGSLGAPGSGIVNISSGATLDVGGSTTTNNTDFGSKQFNVVGTGVGGQGAIINSNTTNGQQNAFNLVTLTGNTTFGAYGRFDLRDGPPVLDLAGFTLTKKGTAHFGIVAGTITDGNIVVEEGIFAIEGASTVAAGTGMITFQDNTELRFFGTTGAGTITRPMQFNGSVGIHNNDDAPSTFDSPVALNGSITYTWVNDADPASPTTQNGVITELGGSRGIEAKTLNAANSLVLTADNMFTGSLAVSGPGTVNISPVSGTPYLGNTANVSLDTNSILGLNYNGTDTIGALLINGVSVAPGVYGPGATPLPQLTSTLTGTLTVTTQMLLPGDFNADNTVDAEDYVVWRQNAGTFNTLANDPLSGTEVDDDQYNVWRAHFGNSIPGSGAGVAVPGSVPEPGAIMLALMALVGTLCLRSRGVRAV